MRAIPAIAALPLLVCFVAPVGASAQNYFGDVPNEPRPSEFIHWDAEALADFRGELEGRIEAGERTWGTRFQSLRALEAASYRPHNVSIVHREGYTQPEIHTAKWDIYVIVEGSGTVLVGGERVDWIEDGRPPEEQRPQLRGAREFQVTEGDLVHVPARSWHQVLLEPGESMTYVLINIMDGTEEVD